MSPATEVERAVGLEPKGPAHPGAATICLLRARVVQPLTGQWNAAGAPRGISPSFLGLLPPPSSMPSIASSSPKIALEPANLTLDVPLAVAEPWRPVLPERSVDEQCHPPAHLPADAVTLAP